MPLLVTYRGHRVKRRHRTADGLRIKLAPSRPGRPGAVIFVTQAEWDAYGAEVYLSPDSRTELPHSRSFH